MATETTLVEIDRERIRELAEREEARLDERTPASRAMYERARATLSGGVASSYQVREPWPIYLDRGVGAKVWDVDGNELLDFHNGFGSMVQGHANPAIGKAVMERYPLGTHFAAPTADGVVVAEELARRWGLPKWRYTNSGSEATMDAIRIARAATGCDTIVKIFGSYHGHHDYVMVSIGVEYEKIGHRDTYESLPYGAGIPQAVAELTVPVPFNDAPAMERRIERLIEEGRKPACVIMEAAMMNLGVVLPEPGYLEAVRDLTRKHGIILIFDEVKTGLCIAAGGATERFGVLPDMVTLAKTLGGGLPSGAIGGTEEAFEVVENGSVYQVGTYNGNPLTMAAARASLLEVLTADAYEHLDALNDRILAGCQRVIDDHRLPGYAVGVGAKGCVTFSPTKIVDYETYKENQDGELCDLAWLYNMNRGVFMTPGREEEWTLSVVHSFEDCDAFVAAFEEMASDLTE
jgi:glutamate-1-semialdehyde 2,1-aminomutase